MGCRPFLLEKKALQRSHDAERHKAPPTQSIRADVVFLADLDPVVAQDGKRGGGMKKEVRKAVVQQIRLAAEALFLRRSGLRDDFACVGAFKLARVQAVQERQHPGDARLQRLFLRDILGAMLRIAASVLE